MTLRIDFEYSMHNIFIFDIITNNKDKYIDACVIRHIVIILNIYTIFMTLMNRDSN